MGKYEEAVKALNELLGHTPVDAEAWAELSDIYFILSLYPQALFCLEEVLLIFPNAWNVCYSEQLHHVCKLTNPRCMLV